MKAIDAVKKYYADKAEKYNIAAGYTDPQSEKLRKNMKKRYQKYLEGHKVLEIACGTGYWTKVIAKTASSVLAIDVNKSMVSLARKRLVRYKNVSLRTTDAYTLNRISGKFSAAFSHWWWSHMPKSRIRKFLVNLHKKLEPGARVLFSDHLPGYTDKKVKVIYNKKGDRFEERILSSEQKCYIIKNFLTEKAVYDYLKGLARNVNFKKYRGRWELTYNVIKPDCTVKVCRFGVKSSLKSVKGSDFSILPPR